MAFEFNTRFNEKQTYRMLDNTIEQDNLEREHEVYLRQQEEFAKALDAKRKQIFGTNSKKKPLPHGQCERFEFFGTFSEARVFIGTSSETIRVATPDAKIYEFADLDSFVVYANEIRAKHGKQTLQITTG